jgi:predicted ester cyclase
MKTLIQELLLAFPDWHVTVEDMFAQDNKVVTRWSLAATHLAPYHDIPATGLKIRAEGFILIISSMTKSPNGGRAIILPRSSTG